MNMLTNGGFERADRAGKPTDWTTNGLTDAAERRSGARSLFLRDGASASQDVWWPMPGAKYACAIWLKTEDVRPTAARGYAYLAVYQFDLAGGLVAFRDFAQLTGTNDWKRFTYTFEAARNAARLSVRVGLFQAQGRAWVDDAVLVEGDAAPELAAVTEPAAFAPPDGKGRIAILKDSLPVEGVASSPDHLGQVLRTAGFDVSFLSADALADPQQFNRRKLDLVVLPYGASFPLDAHRAFLRFLQQGGHFISLGGYAFDNLLVRQGDARSGGPNLFGKTPQQVGASGVPDLLASGWKSYDWRPEARCGPELLPDPGFEDAKLTGWQKRQADLCRVDDSAARSGKHSGVVSVPPQDTPPQAEWFTSMPLKQGVEYHFSAWIRTQGVKPTTEPGYAYVAAYQYGPDPPDGEPAKLVAHRDVLHVVGDSDWQSATGGFKPEPGAVRVE
ncbi:MAG: hypothetical protein FJ279_14380, partial [Planctomycetes bacterium]|nr:hypothetical protein [Planctomycetota bacterium]